MAQTSAGMPVLSKKYFSVSAFAKSYNHLP